jgi:two-component system cell cycle sensor histidine kinase/response regulator CckA
VPHYIGLLSLQWNPPIAEACLSSSHSGATSSVIEVLVADDEPQVRRFAKRVLAEEGYTVHEAADGAEALELARGRRSTLNAVVSDIVMPRLNGVELLQILGSECPELPVLLMSGYGSTHLAELGVVAPCSVLVKPFSPDLLLEEVRRCLRNRS